MQTISHQEAEDLARSLPWEESTSWGGVIFMFGAITLTLWLLNKNNGTPKQLPTLSEVEAKRDLNRKRINPLLALGEFYAVVLLANWLSQWGMWLSLMVYSLGITLIGWQAWWIYHEE
ncbi:MAG: hypothetical protein GVY17_00050 [Cyanobacteria bacterium]|jgi:hypothetical protein|nr:hypothetical protein [Cyanobacteria bacterium GSL.Bin21]